MKTRILITIGTIIMFSNLTFAQYTDIIIPEDNGAAADINNTTSAITENYSFQSDLLMNSKNHYNMFNSSLSVGTSIVASKYISVFNIPIGYSFKSKLFFKSNANAYENLSFKAIVPYVQKKFEAPNLMYIDTFEYETSGIGDLILKANYNLVLNRMFFSFGVYAKFPTAKKENMVKDRDIPLGTGSTDLNISVFFSKKMSEKINVHSSFGYDIRSDYTSDDITLGYGDRINFLVGGDYLFKVVKVGADIAFSSVENTKVISMGFPSEMPGITVIDVLPYFKVGVTETMEAKLFGVIPISSKWKSVDSSIDLPDPDRKMRVGFSFIYRFDKSPEQK